MLPAPAANLQIMEGNLGVNKSPLKGLRARPWGALANLALLAVTVCISLLGAELSVRLLAPQQLILKRSDIWQPADTLGWIHRPNVNTTINTGERVVQFRTDGDGYRVARSGRREGANHTVLLLGDSFMEALQVEYEQSLPGLLDARLPLLLNGTVAVRNAGVGGWNPDQYLLYLRRAVGREKIDLLLVSLFMENDIVTVQRDRVDPRPPALIHPLRWPSRLAWAEIVDAWLYPVNDALEVRSHLFILLKNWLQAPLMRLGLTEAEFYPVYLKSEVDSERWAITAEMCQQIAEVARSHGLPMLVGQIPASYQVDTAIFRKYTKGFRLDPSGIDLDQPDRIMGEKLRNAGISVVDALPALRQAFAAGVRPYGSVDRHLSPDGHEIVAALVQDTVAALLGARTTATGSAQGRAREDRTKRSYR